MSTSFANQVLAQMDRENRGNYQNIVYTYRSISIEEVARLHLSKIGAKPTILSVDEQADYINVPVEGPFKKEEYRY